MTNRKKEARLNFGYPFIVLCLHVPIAQINPLQGLFRPPIGPISATRPQSQKYGFVKNENLDLYKLRFIETSEYKKKSS